MYKYIVTYDRNVYTVMVYGTIQVLNLVQMLCWEVIQIGIL